MKKVILLLFMAVCINVNAQTENKKVEDNSLPNNELQLEFGEGMFILNHYVNGFANTKFSEMKNNLSPTLSLSFHKRANKWLWYGASLSYQNNYRSIYYITDYGDGDVYYNFLYDNVKTFAFAPSVRFSYVNKENLTMYSGAQLGMSYQKCTRKYPENSFYNKANIVNVFYQATLFGISYGKKFYIGGEIGYGNKGLLNLTAGYRF